MKAIGVGFSEAAKLLLKSTDDAHQMVTGYVVDNDGAKLSPETVLGSTVQVTFNKKGECWKVEVGEGVTAAMRAALPNILSNCVDKILAGVPQIDPDEGDGEE